MKTINNFIIEKLRLGKTNQYSCQPKTKEELRDILEERLQEDKNADLNDIDVSKITDMSSIGWDRIGLFENLDPHNIDISLWNVSNVTDMKYMFDDCQNFNSDLSKWDVSKVEDMFCMFRNCKRFNCDLNDWNTNKVKNYIWMFYNCPIAKNPPKWLND